MIKHQIWGYSIVVQTAKKTYETTGSIPFGASSAECLSLRIYDLCMTYVWLMYDLCMTYVSSTNTINMWIPHESTLTQKLCFSGMFKDVYPAFQQRVQQLHIH